VPSVIAGESNSAHRTGGGAIKRTYQWVAGVVALTGGVVCALLLGLGLRLHGREHVLHLLDWLHSIGMWGPAVFVLIEIAIVLLLLPGLPFTMGAGFLFGPIPGTVYVVVGHTLGGALALLAARTVFGKRMAGYLRRRPQLRDLERRLTERGWKTILLTRLIPFFPFKLSNYAFGIMGFRVRDFLIGTGIGTIPISATNVYAGSLAADLAVMGAVSERGTLQWAGWWLGLAALLALVLILGKVAQEKINSAGPK
jgi:uncharacterized membrane protein YdjX (TVP38/TMEM64 family)